MINAKPSEILFLSGGWFFIIFLILGSESINQALIGGVRALNDKRRTIIASCFEHPAVNETLEYLLMNWLKYIDFWRKNTTLKSNSFK